MVRTKHPNAARPIRYYPVPDFKVGDKVSYSVQFLASIGINPTDPMCHARGEILELQDRGMPNLVAKLSWAPDFPEYVNTYNLALVGPNPRHCNVD